MSTSSKFIFQIIKQLLLITLSLIVHLTQGQQSQEKHTISGYITDKTSQEALIGANIYDEERNIGTTSNNYGFFSLTLPAGDTIELRASYVGYSEYRQTVVLTRDRQMAIQLKPSIEIEKVTIRAKNSRVETAQTSMLHIPISKLAGLPTIMGESDILKALQHMPGVQPGLEGSSSINVRGGSPDQNLILLDGVPVYNVNHLFGIFSVFNTDAIKSAKLYKGGFPAEYGGRVSSVLDIRMKEGNKKEFHGKGSIGLVASKLTFEGPIKKDTTSFLISARRTYLDLLLKPFMLAQPKNDRVTGGYFFHDINTKINHQFSEKNRLFFSAYAGKDKLYAKETVRKEGRKEKHNNSLGWGNVTSVLRWNYIFSNKLFSNTTVSYSQYKLFYKEYNYEKPAEYDTPLIDHQIKNNSGIHEVSANLNFNYYPTSKHDIKFGTRIAYNTFSPSLKFTSNLTEVMEGNIEFNNQTIRNQTYSIYLQDNVDLTHKWKANIGLRYSLYKVRDVVDHWFEPRLNLGYKINEKISLKASYSKSYQNLHVLSRSTVSLPLDVWVPATEKAPTISSDQYVAGMVYLLPHHINMTIEGYYKSLNSVISYKEGADLFASEWENVIEVGDGYSYGGELLLKKTTGPVTGWLSYTYSRSFRKFPVISLGNQYPYKYDRPHSVNLSLSHAFNDNFSISGNWVYYSGNLVTLELQQYKNYSGEYLGYIEEKNNVRLPPTHRLDISISLKKQKRWGQRTWKVGLYNAYFHPNPTFIRIEDEYGYIEKFSLLPVMPFASYNFEF